ncbi:MAG: ChbG/HpnK family deacetylase [Erysipelotrichaceae bacterium]|jgi:hypothetical protein|nr:ChbG/HpnK family deacetylase [Erysipelotrichaceae bacterium]
MKKDIAFITRADDGGSTLSANKAIEKVLKAGFIKNVSLMASGPFIEDAAKRFNQFKDVCFGLHITLNAEWDKVKWKPVTNLKQDSGLLDSQGYFYNDPRVFESTKPKIAVIIKEIQAQYEKLLSLGFDVRYLDTHMMPELVIPGLDEAIEDFAKEHKLIDHMYYYKLPPGLMEMAKSQISILKWLRSIPEGQYFFVVHPSLNDEEMRQCGNAENPGEVLAKSRARETFLMSSKAVLWLLKHYHIRPLRYDQAKPMARMTSAEVLNILQGGQN